MYMYVDKHRKRKLLYKEHQFAALQRHIWYKFHLNAHVLYNFTWIYNMYLHANNLRTLM